MAGLLLQEKAVQVQLTLLIISTTKCVEELLVINMEVLMLSIQLAAILITHGAPRQHIWSYVADVTESNCPCLSQSIINVGDNYYCESGNPAGSYTSQLYTDDKLWDGQQCEGSCCTGTRSPPWFSVQLSAPTNDTIEVRICGDESTDNEDNPVELIELYINKYN